MENTRARKHPHHFLRRKYKRYAAAAVAGALLVTGATLPSISPAKAFAAEASNPQSIAQTNQNTDQNKDRGDRNGPPGYGWHQHRNTWPSSDDNQAWYQDGHLYYRNTNSDRDSAAENYLSSPVNFVQDNAATYGFDGNLDSFTLLTMNNHRAVVQVTKHDTGKIFNVILERTYDRDWQVTDVSAI